MARLIGTMQCRGLDCSEKVAINETAGASLSCKCGICGFSTYAPPGTKSARRILAQMTPDDDAAAAPRADPPPAAPTKVKAAPAPVLKSPVSVFSLGDL